MLYAGGVGAGVGTGVGMGVGGSVGAGVGAGVGEKHVSAASFREEANAASSSPKPSDVSSHTPALNSAVNNGVGAPFAMVQFASRKACCVGASQLPPIMTATVPLGMLGSSRSDVHAPTGMVSRELSPVQLALP